MANSLYLHLGLEDSEFRRRLKVDSSELMSVAGQKAFVRLQLDDSDFRKKLQSDIERAYNIVSKMSYMKGGRTMSIIDVKSAQEALRYYEREMGKSKYNTRQRQTFEKNALKAREYLDILARVANEIHRVAEEERRMATANTTAQVNQARKGYTAQEQYYRNLRRINGMYGEQAGILGRLGTLARSYFSIYTIAYFGKKLAEMTGFFERQQVALESIVGSASEASKLMNQIKEFSLKSPLEAKDLIQYTKQLSAYQIPTKELFKDMTMLADLSQGLGVSMDRLILAYGQVRSASVLRGQELRQFTEAGIPLVQKLADKFTELRGELVTTGDVFKLISERSVPFEMVAEVLRDMTAEGGKFNDMQEKLSGTVYGQMQKIKDIWNQTLDNIGKRSNGLIMSIIKAIQSFARNFNAIIKGAIAGGSILLLFKLPSLFTAVGMQVSAVQAKIAAMNRLLRITTGTLKRAQIVMAGLSRAASAIGIVLGVAIGAIVSAIQSAVEEEKRFQESKKEIEDSFVKDNKKLIDGLDSIYAKLRRATKGTNEYEEAISSLKSNYSEFINITKDVIDVLSGETSSVQNAADAYGGLRQSILDAIEARNRFKRDEDIIGLYANKIAKNKGAKFIRNIYGNYFYGEDFSSTFSADEVYDIFIGAIEQALIDMVNNKETSIDDFGERISDIIRNRIYDVDEDALQDAVKKFKLSFNIVSSTKEWKYYLNELKNFYNSETNVSYEYINNLFNNITAIGNDSVERFKDGQIKALKALRIALLSDELGFGVAKRRGGVELLDEIDEAIRNFDYNKIEQITKKLKSLISSFGQSETNNITKANELLRIFQENTENLDKRSAEVKKRIEDNFNIRNPKAKNYNALAAEMYNGLNAENYSQRRDQVKQRYDDAISALKSLDTKKQGFETATLDTIKNLFSETDKDYETIINLINKRDTAHTLMGADYFRIAETEKRGGHIAYNYDRTYKVLVDLQKRVRSGFEAQKKVAGLTSYNTGFGEFVGSLSENNILRQFLDASNNRTNPFNDFLDELEKAKIDVSQFRDISSYMKENGAIDFERIWRDMENALEKKLNELRAAATDPEKDPNVRRFSEVLAQMKNNGAVLFGNDEIAKRIDKAILELTRIGENTRQQVERFNQLSSLAGQVGYSAAAKALGMDGENAYYQQISDLYRTQFNNSLAQVDQSGMRNYVDKLLEETGMRDIMRAGGMNIGNLGNLMDLYNRISTQQEGEPEEFEKVRQIYTNILKNMLDAVLKEIEQRAGLASNDERVRRVLENVRKRLDEAKKVVDDADEINDKSRATIEATQSAYEEIRKELGGSDLQSYTKRFFGDKNSSTGIKRNGELAEMILGAFGGGGQSFQEMFGNVLAQKVVGGSMSAEMASGMTGDIGGYMAIIDAIIKAVYGAIKSLLDLTESITQLQESMNGLTSVSRDAAGRVHIDENGNVNAQNRYDEHEFERRRKGMEIAAEYNQHVMDGWEDFKNGNYLGAVVHVITSITDMINGFNELHDMSLTQQQEDLAEDIERIGRAIDTIEYKKEFMTQSQRFAENTREVNRLYEQRLDLQKQMELESQKKAVDTDKLQEYADQVTEKEREAVRLVKSMREEITGTADDLSSRLTDAMVTAFRNGENAARAWRDSVKQYLSDMLKDQLLASIFAPRLQTLIDNLMGGTEEQLKAMQNNGTITDFNRYVKDRLSDTSKVREFERAVMETGEAMVDFHDALPDYLKDLIDYNSQVQSLGGGLESMTEDTARRAEALSNAQLGEQVMIRVMLQQYLPVLANYDSSAMSSIQTAIVQIASDTSGMHSILRTMQSGFDELRNTSSRPLHVTMS